MFSAYSGLRLRYRAAGIVDSKREQDAKNATATGLIVSENSWLIL